MMNWEKISLVLLSLLLHLSAARGDWSHWSPYTKCSRTCGGGVMHKDRRCIGDRSRCVGDHRKYKLCNTKTCQAGEDFRTVQCRQYNDIPLDGVLYLWKPYYGTGETCELLCYADGYPFYHKLADKVVDGTPCKQDKQRVCIGGHCKNVGCDKRIGSNKFLDACGVCGGNNATCSERETVSGVFNVSILPPGYSSVVEIPANAKDIYIRELGTNLNPIVIWDSSGDSFAIEPDTRKAKLKWKMSGTTFRYLAGDPDNTYGIIKSAGPTSTNITLFLVRSSGDNPGIQYRFSIPKIQRVNSIPTGNRETNVAGRSKPAHTPATDDRSQPKPGLPKIQYIDVQQNSKDRNSGAPSPSIVRPPSSIRISTSHVSKDSNYINRGIKPNSKPVRYSDTGSSESHVDQRLTRKQLVYENGVQVIGQKNTLQELSEAPSAVPAKDSATASQVWGRHYGISYIPGNKRNDDDDLRERDVTLEERYQWSSGQWTECSKQCGVGYRRRVVSCVDREMRKTTEASFCRSSVKPSHSRTCNNGDCAMDTHSSYVRWQVGAWGPCSRSCDLGDQVQEVFCESVLEDGQAIHVDDELCLREYHAKPQYRRSCNDGVPCTAWKITPWSRCSVTCGVGYQVRRVDCRGKTTVLPEESCDPSLKPQTTQNCRQPQCNNPRGTRRSCLDTYYGCCPDGITPARGRNNYGCKNIKIGVDDATVKNTDKPQSNQAVSNICTMEKPLESFCTEWEVKWFYNTEKEICDRFWYGGCDTTSQNLFSSEEQCQKSCKNMVEEDVCSQPVVTGRCRARHPRWYYNKERRECLKFVYGGCDGNGNRFRTEADCERTCLSGTSALGDEEKGCDSSPYGCCPDRKTAARGKNNEGCPSACQSTFYGCCDDDVTQATGPNQEGCETIEISSGAEELCDQAPNGCCPDGVTAATGPNNEGCGDAQLGTVISGGTDPDIVVDVAAQCKEPKDTGPCRTNPAVMWYYDTAKQSCQRFWYGGCHGNNNRFKSEKECLTTCQNVVHKETRPTVAVCEQPKEIGPCNALLPRWFYNRDTRTCEEFSYGGCRGNNNNFQSQLECERYCGRGTPVSKPGTCPSYLTRVNGVNCTSNCRYDGDCAGDNKCCHSGDRCYVCSAPDSGLVVSPEDVCAMSPLGGSCLASIERYYHNRDSQQCETFTYGGCGGNRNNFETLDACQKYCRVRVEEVIPDTRTNVRQSPCSYAPAKGPCNRGITKYYYNTDTMTCETFNYGGCLGNHNNFETEAKCTQYCGLRTGSSWKANCELTPEPGTCRGNYPRWYYDSQKGRCFEFTYGGCQGNANNFADERTCTSTCRVPGPVVPITPRPTVAPPREEEDVCSLMLKSTNQCNYNGGTTSWYYDGTTGTCREIANGECNSNRNNFQSREQCERYCSRDRVCQPLTYSTTVRCLALIPRWTYDSRTGKCESFSYGGCGGSANNFNSEEACERKCNPGAVEPVTRAPEPQSRSEICAMPENAGNCLAYIRNWRYDSLTGQCVEFTYGGCGGNKNNFDSKEECKSFCSRPVVCQAFEEPEVSCLAYYTRWRYDPGSAQCENFVYGGCGGNANNFETFDDCERKCVVDDREEVDNRVDNRFNTWRDICNLQADVGPCKQYIRRWHHNSVSQTCEEFTYGGCLGNHNNFESKLQCMTYCDSTRTGGQQTRPTTTEEPDEIEGSGELPTTLPSTGIDVCALDSETGPCRAYLRQWYYNHMVGECQQFVYGGCRGNGNRFATQEECETQCSPREVCLLTQQSGYCMAYIPRWFFDYNEQRCKEFVYGGCDGNANNFENQETCEKRCGSLIRVRPPEVNKEGTCPSLINSSNSNGKCIEQCRKDGDCDGSKKCCTFACSLVCVEPKQSALGPAVTEKPGFCPPGRPTDLLGACAPTCQDDAVCPSDEKCCYHGCGLTCVAPVGPAVSEKPGFCPPGRPTDLLGACAPTCQDDAVCPGEEKCCYHGCGLTCVAPVGPAVSEKPGFCPPGRPTDLLGACAPTCQDDAVCPGDEKCCYHGCGLTCVAPVGPAVSEKPGFCPPGRPTDLLGACAPTCQDDAVCPGDEKCCYHGCGLTCVAPVGPAVSEKPGFCPPGRPTDLLGACAPTCQDDAVCPGDEKCCYHGCGLTCVAPVGPAVADKPGFCPPRTERPGLLGACAPTCQDDTVCPGDEKCCHHGCGLRCVAPVEVNKEGTCPSPVNSSNSNGKCIEQCGKDSDCDGSKKCCTFACSLVCVEPEQSAPGPAITDKPGFCPPRTDWQGLLGACAPACQDDTVCPGDEKCCYHGCGLRCIGPVEVEPYQMDAPVRIQANAVSEDAVHLTWQDPSLGSSQLIRDGRYYTVRYHSYSIGQYNYMNVTDLRGHVNGLRSDTEYEFSVRVNNPPYLSEWSEGATNKTKARQIVIVKPGQCPAVQADQVGICVEECQSDGNCNSNQKCCSNGCGKTCVYPVGFDICTLPTDTGSCAKWEVRWFYNSTERRCDRFWYGGCNDGNENNFMTEDDCKRRCVGYVPPVTTEAPAPPGPYHCGRTMFGCCADGYTTARDAEKSNCEENRQQRDTVVPVTPGESVVIDCRSGPNVTWYRDGKLVETNTRLRVRSDGTIEVFAATIDDDGVYACHVGEYGRTTMYRYVLQVRVPIGILPGPDKIMVKPNHQAFLHCEVYGNPTPAITWQRYGSDMQSSEDHKTFSNGTLLIHRAKDADQGEYMCIADNGVSQSARRTMELVLREMLVARIENDNGRVMEGSRIVITCEGRGYPQPTITWEKMGRPLNTNGNVYISDTGRLVIRDVTTNDSGVYKCIVANDVEKIETSTSVQVVPKSMPDDKCEDKTSLMKCRLIVTARLCGYTMYSKICCNSCLNYFVNGE